MGKAAGVDNTSRKTWDKAEFHRKAQEREAKEKEVEESKLDARARKRRERDPLHQGIIVARGKIKAREREIDLASNLGRSYVHIVAVWTCPKLDSRCAGTVLQLLLISSSHSSLAFFVSQ